jgi:hypothetical protein
MNEQQQKEAVDLMIGIAKLHPYGKAPDIGCVICYAGVYDLSIWISEGEISRRHSASCPYARARILLDAMGVKYD